MLVFHIRDTEPLMNDAFFKKLTSKLPMSASTTTMLVVFGVCVVATYVFMLITGPKATADLLVAADGSQTSTLAVADGGLTDPAAFSTPYLGPNPTPTVIGEEEPSPPAYTPPSAAPTPQAIALARSQWLSFQRRAEEARAPLPAVASDLKAFTALVRDLPRNDAGRRIAADPGRIDEFLALTERPLPDSKRLESLNAALDLHVETAKTYLGQTESVIGPDAALEDELARKVREAESLEKELRRNRLALESLVTLTAEQPPAKATLEQAIKARKTEIADHYREELTAARAKAREDSERRIREAEERALQLQTDAEVARIAKLGAQTAERIHQETELKAAEMAAADAKRKQDEEAARLKRLAQDPAIQRQYSAFLTPGRLQFNSSPNGLLRTIDQSLPASFGQLSENQWLENVENFARGLSAQPNPNYNTFNDRPTLPYPKTQAEWQQMEQRLAQFKELAPVWIELGVLRP